MFEYLYCCGLRKDHSRADLTLCDGINILPLQAQLHLYSVQPVRASEQSWVESLTGSTSQCAGNESRRSANLSWCIKLVVACAVLHVALPRGDGSLRHRACDGEASVAEVVPVR